MALATLEFGSDLPDDARLLLGVRPADLLDAGPDPAFRARRDEPNVPLRARLEHLATALTGSAGPRAVEAVTRAVVDLPYAALRRHAPDAPEWLADDLAAAVRALLTVPNLGVRQG